MDPKRPAVWPGFVAWIAGVLASVLFSIPTAGAMLAVHFWDGLPSSGVFGEEVSSYLLSAPVLVASAFGSGAGLAATAVAGSFLQRWRAKPPPLGAPLELGPSSFGWLRGAGASLGVLGISFGVNTAAHLIGFGENSNSAIMNRAFERASPLVWVLSVVVIGGLAPVAEELLFRGFLLPVFARRWGAAVGIGISALMFGITHGDLLQGSFAVLVGLYLGWLATKSGSIRWAIAAHAVNNASAVIVSHVGGRATTTTTIVVVVLAVVFTVVGVVSTHGVKRRAQSA